MTTQKSTSTSTSTSTSAFNQCSQLIEGVKEATTKYHGLKETKTDPLQVMIDMQRLLQKRLATDKPEFNKDPDTLETAGEILDWIKDQDDSIADETRELYTSLGGMSNGEKDASSVWKKWKARHGELRSVKIQDMSHEDQLEIKFELIDQLHFFLNKVMVLGLDAQEIFELYYLKNAENFNRQDKGY